MQFVEHTELVEDIWLERAIIEPELSKNSDGLWRLRLHRQGKHGEFEIPYIDTQIIMADSDLGFVVVLVGYHGTEPYGPSRSKHVQKGQFYRFYRQSPDGDWESAPWRKINDELRALIIETTQETGPEWARKPGKLSSERASPAKPVITTAYKVVRVIDGNFYSLYDPTQEYILGERLKQAARPGHRGGYFSHLSLEQGQAYLASCARAMPFHREVATPHLALLECEIGGKIINYGHKMASTYLCPIRVIEVRIVPLGTEEETRA